MIKREPLSREFQLNAGHGPIFTQGHEVGRLAHQMFPGGVLIEQDHRDPEGALSATVTAINSGAPAIYEAAFQFEDLLVRADIVIRNNDGTWDLVEVKSSTKVKDEHLSDVAIQKFVISGSGLKLRRSCLLHLNSKYVRRADAISPVEIFTLAPLDAEIQDEYAQIVANLQSLRMIVRNSLEPSVRLSSACKNPYPCEFKGYCWDAVTTDSIHYLGRILDKKRNALLDKNIETISQIPDGFALSEAQEVEAKCQGVS